MKTTRKKPQTNAQFVESLMESYKVGVLAQLVVLAAIDNYTKTVAKLTKDELLESFPENGMIRGESWMEACKEIQEKLVNRS